MLEYHLYNLVKPYRSLRLSYINLDNPAFTSEERGEDYPWEDEETGMNVDDSSRGYKEPASQRGAADVPHSSSGMGKSIPPSSKGNLH